MRAELTKAGITYEWRETTRAGEAAEAVARALEQGFTQVIGAGGDGHQSEGINGMIHPIPEQTVGPLAVIPLGTANDFATNLGVPLELEPPAIASAPTSPLDLGRVADWASHCNSPIGLEPLVTLYNERMVRVRGTVRHLLAALRAIAAKREWIMKLTWDHGEFDGPVSLVSIGQNPLTGGLFRMAPATDSFDEKLTFVRAYAAPHDEMLQLLPQTMIGTYLEDPRAHPHHTRRLRVEVRPGTTLQVDGELRGMELNELELEVLPARLDLIFPEPT